MNTNDEKNVVVSVTAEIEELRRKDRLRDLHELNTKQQIRTMRILVAIIGVVIVLGISYAIWRGSFQTVTETTQPNEVASSRINSLENSFDTMRSMLFIVIGIGTLFGSIGALFSWNSESRSQESHSLAIERDKNASTMTASSFAESLNTIRLVNGILTLAGEATTRAEEARREQIATGIKGLNSEISAVLGSADDKRDYKQLVEDKGLVLKLEAIYDRLEVLKSEAGYFNLPVPAEFFFVKGIRYHSSGNSGLAIEFLGKAASEASGEGGRLLKEFANYWGAYENDIMSKHLFAADSYNGLSVDVKTRDLPLSIALETLGYESRFFAAASVNDIAKVSLIRGNVEDLLGKAVGQDPREIETRAGIHLLIGNISVWLAYAHNSDAILGKASSFKGIQKSGSEFKRALDAYNSGNSIWWSGVGVLEVKALMGITPSSSYVKYDEIAKIALSKRRIRREPRSRFLLAATATIANVRSGKYSKSVYETCLDDLGEVSEGILVYSPFKKFLVETRVAQDEMEIFLTSHGIKL
jgi:hypothetical protein